MTRRKGNAAVDRAAEAVGHAIGSVAGKIDSLHARHPHPVKEGRDAVAAAQKTAAALASSTRKRAAKVLEKAKAAARLRKKAATRARRKKAVARATRQMVKRASKAVTRGRKTVTRAIGRLKKR